MNTWELVLFLTSINGFNVILILPSEGRNIDSLGNDIIHRFNLDPDKFGILHFDLNSKGSSKKKWPARDEKIAEMADLIIPVSIRPGGNLEKLLIRHRSKILSDFTIPYNKTGRHRPEYKQPRYNPDLPENSILVHFTRTTASSWPDETDYDFYQAIVASKGEYCRSARETLLHILQSRKIYSSSRNIRDGFGVVGFTLLSSDILQGLFRYRPRLVNPYFEPYGIGLPISVAIQVGLRPVRYGSPEDYSTLAAGDKPFFQNAGNDGIKWRMEKEWRHLGDFFLARIPENQLLVFTPNIREAELLRERTNIRVTPLMVL